MKRVTPKAAVIAGVVVALGGSTATAAVIQSRGSAEERARDVANRVADNRATDTVRQQVPRAVKESKESLTGSPVAVGTPAEKKTGGAEAPANKLEDLGPKLGSGKALEPKQYLSSKNGEYFLAQQPEGNLVLYNAKQKALWSTPTAGNPGAHTVMQEEGNLVVYSKANKPLWSTNTTGNPGAHLTVLGDGNVAIFGTDGKPLWSRYAYKGSLPSGHTLRGGQQVYSDNGKYRLAQQDDGNVVLYNAQDKPVWSTPTAGNSGAYTVMQEEGNLVVYSKAGKRLWSTNTAGNPGARLEVHDDGNVVIYDADNKAIWSRHAYEGSLPSGHALQAGQLVISENREYRLVQQQEGNLVLYNSANEPLWTSPTAGNPGARAVMQDEGNLVIYGSDGKPLWTTPTANHPGAYLEVNNEGNVVVYDANNQALWSTAGK